MKKLIKNNKKLFIGILIGGIVFGAVGAYAATTIASNIVQYSNTTSGGASTNVQGALDELYDLSKNAGGGCKSSPFKEGDYVSMTPDATSYSISTDLTGYSREQTINPSELNMWRVIKINDDCSVDMVSSYVSSTNVVFGTSSSNSTGFTDAQVLAYKNFVGTLNTIASQYGKSGYTVKARHTGYKNQTEEISDSAQLKKSTPPWSISTGYGVTVESQGGGDQDYIEDIINIKNAIGGYNAYIVGSTLETTYWLASRLYYYYSATSRYYSGRFVNSRGDVYDDYLHRRSSSTYYGCSTSSAVRPIVTLGSDVKVASGTGDSEANAYTLTK